MSYARKLDEIESQSLISECESFINKFSAFLKSVYYDTGLYYPLSKEIFQIEKTRNYKMQTSILMIMTSVFNWILENNISYFSESDKLKLKAVISKGFNNSEFPTTTSS